MPIMSKSVCQVKYFALSIIHLLVNELVQYFKIFTWKNYLHINWQAIQNSASCVALIHNNKFFPTNIQNFI